MCTPYGGVTDYGTAVKDSPEEYGEDGTSRNGTVKSYGMWMQPPVVGTEVITAFTAGLSEGFLIGTLIKKDRNHMMGGRASSTNSQGEIVPVGEKNPYDINNPEHRPEDTRLTDILETQGLDKDYARGHSMSSPRRETPSNVFGISTLNGHVFTMDDGTESGDSRNIRMRSREGAEVLIDDTNKYIFVTNHAGNAWVEINEHGQIDFYARGDISMHTEKDFNVHADGNINLEARQAVNIKSSGAGGTKIEAATANLDMYAARNFNFEAGVNGNVKVAGSYKETASRIDMNGPVASSASRILINNLVENKNVLRSIASRVPEHHPWQGASSIQESFDTPKGLTD